MKTLPFDGTHLAHGETHEDILYEATIGGLPVDNINDLVTSPNTRENAKTLGRFHYRGIHKGRVELFKSRESISPVARLGVIQHEFGHANSPFFKENEKVYCSKEAREEAREHVAAVATQTLVTEKYLSGYHKFHADNLRKSRSAYEAGFLTYSEWRDAKRLFQEETHAIMIQMRFENPKHLAEVQDAQHKVMARLGKKSVYLTSHLDERGRVVLDGVDKTLVNLISEVHDFQSLENMVNFARAYYQEKYGDTATSKAA